MVYVHPKCRYTLYATTEFKIKNIFKEPLLTTTYNIYDTQLINFIQNSTI